MLTPPSPSRSPSLTPNDATSRKRQRTDSMDSQPSSSSKRSISVDPSPETISALQSYHLTSPSASGATLDDDIDAYMADQGEATIPSALDAAAQHWQNNVATTSNLSGQQRLDLIDKLCENPMQPGTTWYLVSRRWWRRWRKACSGEVDKEGPVTEAELGPVDNSSIVDNYGSVVRALIEHIDVEFVPESVWQHLCSW